MALIILPSPLVESRLRKWFLQSLWMLCWLSLTACATHKSLPVGVTGYNHTDRSIYSFSVGKSAGGGFLGKHEGGGKTTCCVLVPSEYQPGMTVQVGWTDEIGENPQTRTVPVPPYTDENFGNFHVHFLKDGTVKVFVTKYSLRHPNYPLKGEEAKL